MGAVATKTNEKTFNWKLKVNARRVGFQTQVTFARTFQKYLLPLFSGHIRLDKYSYNKTK